MDIWMLLTAGLVMLPALYLARMVHGTPANQSAAYRYRLARGTLGLALIWMAVQGLATLFGPQRLLSLTGLALYLWVECLRSLRQPSVLIEGSLPYTARRRWAQLGVVGIPIVALAMWAFVAIELEGALVLLPVAAWLGCLIALLRLSAPLANEDVKLTSRRRWARRGVVGMPIVALGLWMSVGVDPEGALLLLFVGAWLGCLALLLTPPPSGAGAAPAHNVRRRWGHTGLVGIPLVAVVLVGVYVVRDPIWLQAIIVLGALWVGAAYLCILSGARRLWRRVMGDHTPQLVGRGEHLALAALLALPGLAALVLFFSSERMSHDAFIVVIGASTLLGGQRLRVKFSAGNSTGAAPAGGVRRLLRRAGRALVLLGLTAIALGALTTGWRLIEYQLAGMWVLWVARAGFIGCILVCVLWLFDRRGGSVAARRRTARVLRVVEHGALAASLSLITVCVVAQHLEAEARAERREFACVLESPSVLDGWSTDDANVGASIGQAMVSSDRRTAIVQLRTALAAADLAGDSQTTHTGWVRLPFGGEDPDVRAAVNNIACLMLADAMAGQTAAAPQRTSGHEGDSVRFVSRQTECAQDDLHDPYIQSLIAMLSDGNRRLRAEVVCPSNVSLNHDGDRVSGGTVYCWLTEPNQQRPQIRCPALTHLELRKIPGTGPLPDLLLCGTELAELPIQVGALGPDGLWALSEELFTPMEAICPDEGAIIEDLQWVDATGAQVLNDRDGAIIPGRYWAVVALFSLAGDWEQGVLSGSCEQSYWQRCDVLEVLPGDQP